MLCPDEWSGTRVVLPIIYNYQTSCLVVINNVLTFGEKYACFNP